MAKLTMLELARITGPLLALPRKNRDQVEMLLREKREAEDARKVTAEVSA